jgi:GST-like protein
MKTLADFPITKRWPPTRPDAIQLYSLATPNGAKVSIALEELELPYEAHRVAFDARDQFSPEFLSLNPNNKIPAIIDPNGPGGEPLPLWESGAILLYLAEKTGKLLPKDEALKWQTVQWLMFQMGGIGPMFGQVGYFHHFAGKAIEDKRPLQRYADESHRLLKVLHERLSDRAWIMGDEFTIADIAIFPWVRNLLEGYQAGDVVRISEAPNVLRALGAFLARSAVGRGLHVPKRPGA